MEGLGLSAIHELTRPPAERLAPPSQEAIDRDHAAIHGEMDAAMTRLHADFDAIMASMGRRFDRAQRILERHLDLPSRRGFWDRLLRPLRLHRIRVVGG